MLRGVPKPFARAAFAAFAIAVLVAGGTAVRAASRPAAPAVDARAVDAVMKGTGFVRGGLSGASVAIAVGGRVVFARGYGDRDLGTPDRWADATEDYYRAGRGSAAPRPRATATADTIYDAGSVTKTIVAAAVHALADERALSVDDTVAKWLPAFATHPELTLRNLLEQTSGLPDFNEWTAIKRWHGRPGNGLIEALAHEPLAFTPGSRFAYSNTNYLLLGRIAERAAHEPLGTLLARRFFTPLGMTRTRFAGVASDADVALGYTVDAERKRVRAYQWDLAWAGGAGALTTTAPDLARFDAALMDGRAIPRAAFAAMATPSRADHPFGAPPYAHALEVDRIGSHRVLWHNGIVGGFHAMNALFPDDGIAIVVLTDQQKSAPEILIGPLLAAIVPVAPLDRYLPESARNAAAVLFGGALTALVAVIVAGVWRRRRWWVCVLVALFALVDGFVLPLVVPVPAAFALALVPALLLALPWSRMLRRSGASAPSS